MRESLLQRKVKKAITEKYGNQCWYYHPSDSSQRGIPDIIMVLRGRFIAIELKKNIKSTKPTRLQEYNLMRISIAGGYAFWGKDIAVILKKLDDFVKLNF